MFLEKKIFVEVSTIHFLPSIWLRRLENGKHKDGNKTVVNETHINAALVNRNPKPRVNGTAYLI
jgi:hypothetical protein